jgi:stage V sporulation protein K
LAEVKDMIRVLGRRLQFEIMSNQNKKPDLQHLIFIGNPGSGKTSIARLIGQLYQSLGLLRKGHCVEVSRADLVGAYVGHTAIRTTEKIKEAFDGVIFIDEAYALARSHAHNGDFGQEAIDTLVKSMEDYRNRFLVIVAGYPTEMETFIQSNPGLRSRFGYTLNFPDYSEAELFNILENNLQAEQYLLDKSAKIKALEYIRRRAFISENNSGNGRFVRNLVEQIKNRYAERTILQSQKDGNLSTFKPPFMVTTADIPPLVNLIPVAEVIN